MQIRIGSTSVETQKGDITRLAVDAIVNPANKALVLGAGLAGAVARRGGPTIQEECHRIGSTPVGTAVITTGGRLAARHVIHAVGPRWGEGQEEQKLRGAIQAALALAETNGLASMAFPAVSAGIFGYPLQQAAQVIVGAIRDHLAPGQSGLERVILCLFDDAALSAFEAELASV